MSETTETANITTADAAIKEWTIMIYMGGGNNLSVDMSYALQQIKSVTDNTDKINLFVYFDGSSQNIPTLYCDFSEQNIINYYRSVKIEDKLIKRRSEQFNENSASINNVINFVDWCVNKVEHKIGDQTIKGRKATKYAMIFSGHSFGFQNQGLFKDENADYYMTFRKLRWMFERITFGTGKLQKIAAAQQLKNKTEWSPEKVAERTTPIIGQKLSILGFDSCVMSMMEIGCQFKHVAETMIASEGSIPNAGWSYAQMLLGKIVTSGNISSKEIAASFVENFIRQQNKFSLADISVDLAAWDLKALPDLENAFFNLVEGLLNCFEVEESMVYCQMKRILSQVHWQCQTYMFDQNVDLGDFCSLLSKEIESLKLEFDFLDPKIYEEQFRLITKVGDFCGEISEKIRDCIILSGFTGGDYQFSNGISLFFPWSWASYKVSRFNYESLSFVSTNKTGKKWNEFLQKYLGDVSLRKAKSLSTIKKDGSFEKDKNGSIVYNSYSYIDQTESQSDLPAKNITENNGSQSKIPVNGTNKIPVNGTNKIPVNGTNKIPVNGTNRLYNALSIFFSEFMITKNIESLWYHSGFTSKSAEFSLETNASGETTAQAQTSMSQNDKWTINVPGGDIVFTNINDNQTLTGELIKGNFNQHISELIKQLKENGDNPTNVFNTDFLNKLSNPPEDTAVESLEDD